MPVPVWWFVASELLYLVLTHIKCNCHGFSVLFLPRLSVWLRELRELIVQRRFCLPVVTEGRLGTFDSLLFFPLDYMDIFLAYSTTTAEDILWLNVKGSVDTFPALWYLCALLPNGLLLCPPLPPSENYFVLLPPLWCHLFIFPSIHNLQQLRPFFTLVINSFLH